LLITGPRAGAVLISLPLLCTRRRISSISSLSTSCSSSVSPSSCTISANSARLMRSLAWARRSASSLKATGPPVTPATNLVWWSIKVAMSTCSK